MVKIQTIKIKDHAVVSTGQEDLLSLKIHWDPFAPFQGSTPKTDRVVIEDRILYIKKTWGYISAFLPFLIGGIL